MWIVDCLESCYLALTEVPLADIVQLSYSHNVAIGE